MVIHTSVGNQSQNVGLGSSIGQTKKYVCFTVTWNCGAGYVGRGFILISVKKLINKFLR